MMTVNFREISRVEKEKGLCAYMHIAPFHSQPSILLCLHDNNMLAISISLLFGWHDK